MTKIKFPAISVKRPKNFVTLRLTHQISFYHTQELKIEDPVVCRAKRYERLLASAFTANGKREIQVEKFSK